MNPEPIFVTTPNDAIPNIVRENVKVGETIFKIERPIDTDRLLDHPTIREAHTRDEYMPYWADIWPAAKMLGKAVIKEPWEKFPLKIGDKIEALEIGCGLGVAGVAALSRGLRVTFSDYDTTAVRFAAANARLNQFFDFKTMPLDWRFPPALRFPVLLAADITYEVRNIDPILQLIQKMLLPGGLCLMTDQDRTPAPLLRERLGYMGFRYTKEMVRAGDSDGIRVKGTLYRITIPQ